MDDDAADVREAVLTPSAGTASMDKLAAFTPRLVVIRTVVFTSIAIRPLAVLTWRQGRYDTAAVVARWLTVLLAANSTLMILNAFTRGVQKSFDTQLDNATRDPLTGLLNRRGLELWAEQLLRSHPTRVDFILVDLDHFKGGNPWHDNGLLARTGGEEFTVLMTNRDSSETSQAIRAAVHDPRDKIPVTASVGVATLNFADIFGSDRIDPLREGLRRADIALYEAKRAARNRVQTYPGQPGVNVACRRCLIAMNELHRVGRAVFPREPRRTADDTDWRTGRDARNPNGPPPSSL